MKKRLLAGGLCCLSCSLAAQNGKLWGALELGVGNSFASKELSYGKSKPSDNLLTSLYGTLGYYVTEKISLGAGVGLDTHNNPGLNTFSVCADTRIHPFSQKRLFVNARFVCPVFTSERFWDAKRMASVAVGYQLWKIKKIGITPSLGYNYCRYTAVDALQQEVKDGRSSIVLRVSFSY